MAGLNQSTDVSELINGWTSPLKSPVHLLVDRSIRNINGGTWFSLVSYTVTEAGHGRVRKLLCVSAHPSTSQDALESSRQ